MNNNELEEYLTLIKPALEEYANKNNTTIEDILKKLIKDDPKNYRLIRLEDTNLFNYKGGQSTVYNRLQKSNIATLHELFKASDNFKGGMYTRDYNGIETEVSPHYVYTFPEDGEYHIRIWCKNTRKNWENYLFCRFLQRWIH